MESYSPSEKLDQALKTSLKDPYKDLLSFSVDSDQFLILKLHAGLLKDETMFTRFLEVLRDTLPTLPMRSLKVSFQPHKDYQVEHLFKMFLNSLESIEITKVEEHSFLRKHALTGAFIIGGAVLGPAAIVGAVGALGFTSGGIVAGSAAASIMSSYGGAVASGSACAILQSVGAAGLGVAGTAAAAGTGAAAGRLGAKLVSFFGRRRKANNNAGRNSTNAEEHKTGEEKDEKISDEDL